MRKRHGLILILMICAGLGRAAAQDAPKAEVAGAYSYVRGNQINSGGCCFQMNGGTGSIAVNLNHWFGLAGEIGGYHAGDVNKTGLTLNVVSYLFGPRVTIRTHYRLTPFGEVLVGGGHASGTLYSGASTLSGLGPQNGFAAAIAGGADVRLTPHVAVRLLQADYFLTRFQNGSNNHQNNLRLSAGLVFYFGNR